MANVTSNPNAPRPLGLVSVANLTALSVAAGVLSRVQIGMASALTITRC